MAHSIWLWLEARELLGSNPDRVGYLLSQLCIHSAPNWSKAWSVQWCVYGTVYYKEPLKLFDKDIGLSPFLFLRYCHDYAESNVKQLLSLEIATRV